MEEQCRELNPERENPRDLMHCPLSLTPNAMSYFEGAFSWGWLPGAAFGLSVSERRSLRAPFLTLRGFPRVPLVEPRVPPVASGRPASIRLRHGT